jgi:hypothetical protein
MTKVVIIFWLHFFNVEAFICIDFDEKWVGRKFWAIFSTTHLVTLLQLHTTPALH